MAGSIYRRTPYGLTGKMIPWRSFFLVAFTFILTGALHGATDSLAQRSVETDNYFITFEQTRIDRLDSIADRRIRLSDTATGAFAEKVYFGLVDSIKFLLINPAFDEPERKLFREYVVMQLRKVNGNTVYSVKHFNSV